MNHQPTPPLVERPRSASDIAAALERELDRAQLGTGRGDALGAFVAIAARYAELVTACLNSAPERHLAAFAELLGGQPRPAEAAQAHLTFTAAAGATAGGTSAPVKVPMNTRVAAPPAGGDSEAVVFETQADLDLVRARPVRAVFADAGQRHLTDVSALLTPAGRVDASTPTAAPVTPALHIAAASAFGLAGLRLVRLQFGVQEAGLREPGLQPVWVVATPQGDLPLSVQSDGSAGLTRSGEVVLLAPPDWPMTTLDGVAARWLTLRWQRGPRPDAARSDAGPPAPWRPPRLSALAVGARAETLLQPVAAACHDGVPLDTSKDFFPMGEQPRFGSVFQLTSPVFGEPGARVELQLRMTNPEVSTQAPIATVSSTGKPQLVWELSVASGFCSLAAHDGSASLTQDGSVVFVVPANVAPTTIAGQTGPWLRARLASGHYGSVPAESKFALPVPRAPALRSVAVLSTLERGPLVADRLLSVGALLRRRLDPRLPVPDDAFAAADVDGPALYLGLEAAAGAWANLPPLHWHVRPAPATLPLALGGPPPVAATPRWQWHGAGGWRDLALRDGTQGLARSGIVALQLAHAPAPWADSLLETRADPKDAPWVWLRLVWPALGGPGDATRLPVGLALNSVLARQVQRLRNEVVGSGNGRPPQHLKTLRRPVIGAVHLQVREADDTWVDWQEVVDWSASRADSAHFMLDRTSGELHFGDGRLGRIPPAGANNIRLLEYLTGGGTRGNQPAGAIAKLRSAVPAVESVRNPEAATGGLDADGPDRVRAHAWARLRHRDRAVGADDYVDLAVRASPQVARAFCIAGRDLSTPVEQAGPPAAAQPGVLSVIVIPHGDEACPQPGLDLLATVQAYLDERRAPAGRLVLVGPSYAAVALKVQVVAAPGWSPHEVARACELRLASFLHPLGGGTDGRGWGLGQRPHRSDLHCLLGAVDGVERVHTLSLSTHAPAGRPFVVACGAVEVEAS